MRPPSRDLPCDAPLLRLRGTDPRQYPLDLLAIERLAIAESIGRGCVPALEDVNPTGQAQLGRSCLAANHKLVP